MIELAGYPAFWRFLFTVAQRSGIGGSTYGTNLDTSQAEGRRSLRIEILRLADDGLSVRDPAASPFNALARATSEVLHVHFQQSQEATSDEEDPDDVDELAAR